MKSYTEAVNEQIWKDNLAIIEARLPDLADRLRSVSVDDRIRGNYSRSGLWVLQTEEGTAVHSMYAPEKESLRFCEECTAESVLFLGFGCGYQLIPFLKNSRFRKLLIVETSLQRLKTVLHYTDQRLLLSDNRVEIFASSDAKDFSRRIGRYYHPLWDGELINYPLRALVDREESFFREILQNLGQYFHMLAGDLSSQSFFAKVWFRNILINLREHQRAGQVLTLSAGRPVILAGAGPSLEKGITQIKQRRREDYFLIACDAALRPLLLHEIKPDLVLSLDAQILVCRHFTGIDLSDITLLCDIASPPSLVRRYRTYFFASGHPLAQLSGLSSLDTRGGNVGYAVLSLAKRFASEITHYGFDFCFPQAKAYAQGVYVYPEFLQTSDRCRSYEQLVLSLVFRYRQLQVQKNKALLTYTPTLFTDYKKSFSALFCENSEKGDVEFPYIDGEHFTASYRDKLLSLQTSDLFCQNMRNDPILMTLAPIVSCFIRENMKVKDAWAEALFWAQRFVKKWN